MGGSNSFMSMPPQSLLRAAAGYRWARFAAWGKPLRAAPGQAAGATGRAMTPMLRRSLAQNRKARPRDAARRGWEGKKERGRQQPRRPAEERRCLAGPSLRWRRARSAPAGRARAAGCRGTCRRPHSSRLGLETRRTAGQWRRAGAWQSPRLSAVGQAPPARRAARFLALSALSAAARAAGRCGCRSRTQRPVGWKRSYVPERGGSGSACSKPRAWSRVGSAEGTALPLEAYYRRRLTLRFVRRVEGWR